MSAALLVGLFALFNIGLPIVLVACPMMSNGQACTCKHHVPGGLSITYQGGACCNHAVAAERNTVPFLGSAKYQAPSSEIVLVLATRSSGPETSTQHSQFALGDDTRPPGSSLPRFLLSSSLLI
ncbi:MAG TPA: hypothetical protein VMH23_16390 [Bacteroidota bacterium]|nr:hypothetical protein [Bacteroidota bacterium]